MGKVALIAVLAFGVMGTVYALSDGQARHATEGHIAGYQHEVLARNAALTGLELAKQALADNFAAPTGYMQGTYETVPYTVAISTSGDVATVRSVGMATQSDGSQVPFHITATYEMKEGLPLGISPEAPPFMQYAMMAESHLLLHGTMGVSLAAVGAQENQLNANVHSNTSLRAEGSILVEGFGTAAGPVERTGRATFAPVHNPTGEPVIQTVPRIDLPHFSSSEIIASMNTSDGNYRHDTNGLRISSQSQVDGLGGTRDRPFVWHVSGGQLEISTNIQLPGYVMFVAENGFHITGSVTAINPGYDGPDESSIAIYTPRGGHLDMSGNGTFYGQVFAGENVTISGTVDYYGNIATRQTVDISGTVNVYYRSPSPAFTRAWQAPVAFIELTSYNEY